ncbi:MAG: hypothetical protein LBC28_01535, partial [Oscillospiraceae bacterium]|nr:hypothetical protein [Oscillospiraceae bacterium]
MKTRIFTALFLVLAVLVTLASCAGEGKSENPDESTAPPETIPNAYLMEELFSLGGKTNTHFEVQGGRIYYDLSDPAAQYASVIAADMGGGDDVTLWEQSGGYDPSLTVNDYLTLTTFTVDGAGNLWLAVTRWLVDLSDPAAPLMENTPRLIKLSPDGTELLSVDIPADSRGMVFGVGSMCTDGAGNLYAASSTEIMAFDGAVGEFAFSIQENGYYVSRLARSASGEASYIAGRLAGSELTQKLKTIDFDARSAVEAEYAGSRSFMDIYPGADDGYVYGRVHTDVVKLSQDASDSVIINFINSDIDGGAIGRCVPIDGGEFIAALQDNAARAVNGFVKLSPNPNAVKNGKTVVTLGVMTAGAAPSEAIRAFNAESDDTRVEVIDYGVYNTPSDYTLGGSMLFIDLLRGAAPDILCFTYGFSDSPDKFVRKGVFADLTPYLDGDPEISREDLFESVLDAGTFDGALNLLIPEFYISTAAGKSSIFGDDGQLTLAEASEILAERPEAALSPPRYPTGASEAELRTQEAVSFMANFDTYADLSAGVCRFDSPEFTELLEFTASMPLPAESAADASAYIEDYMTSFKDDRALTYKQNVGGVYAVREARYLFGEDISFVGSPTADGRGGHQLIPINQYAISASSEKKDLSFSFLRGLLSEEYFASGGLGALPMNKKAFEAAALPETTPLDERDYSNGVT